MTEQRENELLRDILLDAAAKEFAPELSGTDHIETSLKFQKSIRHLCTDPEKWMKYRQMPIWKKLVNMAATVLLVCVLTLGVLMLVSPRVYAAVVNWITVQYENAVSYHFGGEPEETQTQHYEITYFPDGYSARGKTVQTPGDFTDVTGTVYHNGSGQTLLFEYFPMESSTAMMCYADDMTVTDIVVNGQPGQMYISQKESESSAIVWMNEQENMCFCVDGFLSSDELLRVAESIVTVQ